MTPSNPMKSGGWQKMMFCVHIWTFYVLSIKIFFSEIATNPLTNRSCYTWVLYISGHLMQFPTNNHFSELGPNLSCCRENPHHSWESQFSITLYRESNSCVFNYLWVFFTDILDNNVTVTFQQLPQVHCAFYYQPFNWPG